MYVKLRKAYGHICLLSCADQVTKAFRSLQLGPADYLEFIIQLVAESHTAFVDKIRWIRSVLPENKMLISKTSIWVYFFSAIEKTGNLKWQKRPFSSACVFRPFTRLLLSSVLGSWRHSAPFPFCICDGGGFVLDGLVDSRARVRAGGGGRAGSAGATKCVKTPIRTSKGRWPLSHSKLRHFEFPGSYQHCANSVATE